MIFCEKNEGETCKNEQDARIRIIKKALTPFSIRCECSIKSKLSAIPFPLCWHISRSFDGLCCMKPTTESEVLVFLVFLATVPASLATDRTTTCTRYADVATSHESNSDLSNQLRSVRVSFKRNNVNHGHQYVLGNIDRISASQLTERQRRIVDRLVETGQWNVLENVLETSATLATLLGVDARTIRRDLNTLQSKGVIRRDGPDRGGRRVILKKIEP